VVNNRHYYFNMFLSLNPISLEIISRINVKINPDNLILLKNINSKSHIIRRNSLTEAKTILTKIINASFYVCRQKRFK